MLKETSLRRHANEEVFRRLVDFGAGADRRGACE